MSLGLGTVSDGESDGAVLPCPTAFGHSRISVSRMPEHAIWIGFGRIRKLQTIPRHRMDAGTVPKLRPREIDFGGCRCQAALLTGNAANTDPVCELSPNRALVDAVLCDVNSPSGHLREWTYRVNPTTSSRAESGRALG